MGACAAKPLREKCEPCTACAIHHRSAAGRNKKACSLSRAEEACTPAIVYRVVIDHRGRKGWEVNRLCEGRGHGGGIDGRIDKVALGLGPEELPSLLFCQCQIRLRQYNLTRLCQGHGRCPVTVMRV